MFVGCSRDDGEVIILFSHNHASSAVHDVLAWCAAMCKPAAHLRVYWPSVDTIQHHGVWGRMSAEERSSFITAFF